MALLLGSLRRPPCSQITILVHRCGLSSSSALVQLPDYSLGLSTPDNFQLSEQTKQVSWSEQVDKAYKDIHRPFYFLDSRRRSSTIEQQMRARATILKGFHTRSSNNSATKHGKESLDEDASHLPKPLHPDEIAPEVDYGERDGGEGGPGKIPGEEDEKGKAEAVDAVKKGGDDEKKKGSSDADEPREAHVLDYSR